MNEFRRRSKSADKQIRERGELCNTRTSSYGSTQIMTREQKIFKAQQLTKASQGQHKVFLENGYLEGTPEEVANFLVCSFEQKHFGKIQIWYIDKDSVANIIE